jgi:hypothetical protein
MPHPHGTINRYNNQRCRCDLCRAAIRDYRRTRRALQRNTPPPVVAVRSDRQPVLTPKQPRTTIDADTAAKLSIGGHAMWTCGHINMWPGLDVIRALFGSHADPSRYPCPQCKTAGIVGTTDPWERPDVPRA